MRRILTAASLYSVTATALRTALLDFNTTNCRGYALNGRRALASMTVAGRQAYRRRAARRDRLAAARRAPLPVGQIIQRPRGAARPRQGRSPRRRRFRGEGRGPSPTRRRSRASRISSSTCASSAPSASRRRAPSRPTSSDTAARPMPSPAWRRQASTFCGPRRAPRRARALCGLLHVPVNARGVVRSRDQRDRFRVPPQPAERCEAFIPAHQVYLLPRSSLPQVLNRQPADVRRGEPPARGGDGVL